MPFVREKIDPEWLPWVTKLAGSTNIGIYNGEWAIDHERKAVFFFAGGDPQDWSQPRNYWLKAGADVFPVEILDDRIWVGKCYGAVISHSDATDLCIEAFQALRR